jgi:hypothetical protein
MNTMASAVTPKTRTVPRSGWSMISAIGTAETPRITASRRPSISCCSRVRNADNPMIRANLANSAGWSWNPASSYQAWIPLFLAPSGVRTPNSRMRDTPAIGMAQSRRWR